MCNMKAFSNPTRTNAMGFQLLGSMPFQTRHLPLIVHFSRVISADGLFQNPLKFALLAASSEVHLALNSTEFLLPRRRICRGASMDSYASFNRSDDEWRAVLTPQQFSVLRQKGTEPPGTGVYDKFFEAGVYNCAGCGTPLYKSTAKFNSGCGWPAFYESLPGAINRKLEFDGRTEISCAACGGHLGHVFKGEKFDTPTDERHCVNSVSIKFFPATAA